MRVEYPNLDPLNFGKLSEHPLDCQICISKRLFEVQFCLATRREVPIPRMNVSGMPFQF